MLFFFGALLGFGFFGSLGALSGAGPFSSGFFCGCFFGRYSFSFGRTLGG